MPPIGVVLFREDDGSIPLVKWLKAIPKKAQAKCIGALRRLEVLGRELRRPEADDLRDEIYELRVGLRGVNYRMLYFFHGRTAIVVSQGLIKERVVPPKEIDRAVERRERYLANPDAHAFEPEEY